MAFGILSAGQRLLVKLDLIGGPKYEAGLRGAAGATTGFAASTRRASAATAVATKQTWAHSQALFTLRRAAFYTTLAMGALAFSVIRMGFAYDSAMEQARVALETTIKPTSRLNEELGRLFTIAALTPFTFKDVTLAFRSMYAGMRPLNIGLKTMNNLILATTNMMSQTGRVTPAGLQKVSYALQHMANVGHLTGYAIQQLARDGVQIMPALRREFHLTGESMAEIGAMGLPAQQVIQAIIKYGLTAPGVMNAALRQSNRTLFGAWSTFKDLLSQSMGQAESGIFSSVRGVLFGVNKELAPLYIARKPVSITRIAEAFDHQLTPSSHAIINMFTLLERTLQSMIFLFGSLFWIVNKVLWPFNRLANLFGAANAGASGLGYVLGGLITVWLLYRGAVLLAALANDIWAASVVLVSTTAKLLGLKWLPMLIKRWYAYATAEKVVARTPAWKSMSKTLETTKDFANKGILAKLSRGFFGLVAPITAAAAASWAFFLANIWWFVIVAAVIALVVAIVILYKKWDWFHKLVNRTWEWIKGHKMEVYAALAFAFGPLLMAALALKYLIEHMHQLGHLARQALAPVTPPRPTPAELANPPKKRQGLWGRIQDALSVLHFTPFQHGGTMFNSGLALVGEAGPELLRLPAGASVIPMTQRTVSPVGDTVAGGGRPPEIIQLVVDRKVLAEVVAHARQDKLARK